MSKLAPTISAVLALAIAAGCQQTPSPATPKPVEVAPPVVGPAPDADVDATAAPAPADPSTAPPDDASVGSVLATSNMTPLSIKASDKATVEAKVQQWLKALPVPQTVTITEAPELSIYSKAYEVVQHEWEVHLGVKQPIPMDASNDLIRASLKYWTAERSVPITAPDWKFNFVTPSSSSSEGIEILSGDGNKRVRIEGKFFMVYGTKTTRNCVPMQDAPAKEHCYLAVNRDVSFTIDLPVPYDK